MPIQTRGTHIRSRLKHLNELFQRLELPTHRTLTSARKAYKALSPEERALMHGSDEMRAAHRLKQERKAVASAIQSEKDKEKHAKHRADNKERASA